MNIPRRSFLKSTLALGGAFTLGSSLLPQNAMADWPTVAFEADNVEHALMALFKQSEIEESDKIKIQTPEIAENGAVVPVEVSTELPQVESITLFAEKNPVPLVGQFNFPDPETAVGWIKTRIKMSETAQVIAVVSAGGKLYSARREVKVTIGGCGG